MLQFLVGFRQATILLYDTVPKIHQIATHLCVIIYPCTFDIWVTSSIHLKIIPHIYLVVDS